MFKSCHNCGVNIEIIFFKRYFDKPISCPNCSKKYYYGVSSRQFTIFIILLGIFKFFLFKQGKIWASLTMPQIGLFIFLVILLFLVFFHFFGKLTSYTDPINESELDDLKNYNEYGHGTSIWGKYPTPDYLAFYQAKVLTWGFVPYRIKCIYKVKEEVGELKIKEKFSLQEFQKNISKSELNAIKKDVLVSYFKNSKNLWGACKTVLAMVLLILVIGMRILD